ncbi:hypothetical protein [Pseudoalteromonas sp. Of7M-16]|uniref:hypothetical protein n=1 Tax=Pseudoalteromonas sp. Of7M-16 TaxID=2917756 RepID=UPI001EF5C5A5|nr:hypothetical protein [Pseudoalteromonas sp. Of7M-16]MCG7548927.1 hypothetical protein [Pseudoalteromonas sp. Of7M-16]
MSLSKLSLTIGTLLASLNSYASVQNVADVDGYERTTSYAYGPVSSVAITSEHAHKLILNVQLSNEFSRCDNANVYSNRTHTNLASLNVSINSHVLTSLTMETEFSDESALQDPKTVHIGCTDEFGQEFNVLVNVPGAPIVDWQVSLQPAGKFIYIPYSYGYHSAYKIESRLSVNNQNTQSYCTTLANRSVSLGLFHGEDRKGPFHSDVFIKNEVLTNPAHQVLYQIIECENAAGKTMAVKVFNLTNPNHIHLWEDQLIVK